MNFCLVCYKEEEEDKDNLILSCQCFICRQCADQWFCTRIKERKFDRKVKCPNSLCPQQKEYEYEDLIEFEQADQQMVINYCQISNDISYCPNCNYKGFFTHQQSVCQESFICDNCNNTWSLASSQSHVMTEIKTFFIKLFSTSNCPQCKASIQKVGGCPQMTCKSCSYKFCWNCKQQQETHVFKQCFLSTFTSTLIQTLPILILLALAGMHQILCQQLIQVISIQSFSEFLTKILDFMFRYTLYHIPLPLLAVSFDNYQMIFTLPKLILTWICLAFIIILFIQVQEFLSITVLEGFILFFIMKFY